MSYLEILRTALDKKFFWDLLEEEGSLGSAFVDDSRNVYTIFMEKNVKRFFIETFGAGERVDNWEVSLFLIGLGCDCGRVTLSNGEIYWDLRPHLLRGKVIEKSMELKIWE